jgi:hypothetical protein
MSDDRRQYSCKKKSKVLQRMPSQLRALALQSNSRLLKMQPLKQPLAENAVLAELSGIMGKRSLSEIVRRPRTMALQAIRRVRTILPQARAVA